MLQLINDKFKGWVTWIIIVVVSAVFILTGISYFFVSSGVSPQAVAKVGDIQVSQNTYQQMLTQNMQSEPSANSKALQQKTLQQLVDQSLLQQDATASHIMVTESAISAAIFQNPAFIENGQYSAKRFDEIAKLYGGAVPIKSMIANSLLTSSIVSPIMQTQFVLKDEIQAVSALMGQKREIKYYSFAAKDFSKDVQISDEALQAYYHENSTAYQKSKEAIVSYVELTSKDFISNEPITTEEIASYYEANKDALFTQELRSGEIITIKKDAKNKEIVAQALKTNMLLTADQQKDVTIEAIKPLSQDQASTYAQFALFNLTMSSSVKETSDNEFVKLTNIDIPKEMTLEQATPIIKRILTNRAALQKFNEVLTSINNNSFEQVVKTNNLKVSTTKPFNLQTTGNQVEGNAKLQEAVLGYNKTQGFISQGQTEGILYKVDKITPQRILSFAEVKDKVKKAYIDQQALKLAQQKAEAFSQILNKEKIDSSKEKAKIEKISRNDFGLDQALKTAIFSDELNQYKTIQNGDAYWVYEVTKVIPGDNELSIQMVQNNYVTIELNDYLTALKNQYPVEINHQLIE